MRNCTIHLDLTGGKDPNGYFEVNVISVQPFVENQVDEMPTTRKQWGEVQIKNEPYNYRKLGGDRYRLYDIIQAQLPTTEIHIKFTSEIETIIGYFGVVDCSVNDDEKVITVKVTALDQYTPYLEGRETEVKLFDEANIVANGKFDKWNGSDPLNWTAFGGAIYEQKYIADKTAISLKNVDTATNSGIQQVITDVLKGKQFTFSFSYALAGEISDRENLELIIYLRDPDIGTQYFLRKDGSWGSFQKFEYAYNVLPISEGSISTLKTYSFTANATPKDGEIYIKLLHYNLGFSDIETFLILSDVRLTTTAIKLNTVKVQLSADNLVTVPQKDESIKFTGKSINDGFFRLFADSNFDISDYFNGDGSPNTSLLASGLHSYNNVTYPNLIEFFQQKSSDSYKFELSKLTVYHGQYSYGKRNYYGIAEFSREEFYLADPIGWDENTDNLIPPATDSGWDWTTQFKNGKRLWVRTPFNDAEDTWLLENKVTALRTTHPEFYFVYHYSQTSTKQYPVNNNSIEITEAIDLREVIRKVYCGSDESLIGKNVYSSFFWNDEQSAEIEAALYDNGTDSNYVSGELPNPLNQISVIHTNDLSTETVTDEEKSILNISGKQLIEDLIVLFPQLYWYIDADSNLHIEHIKFFDRINKAKNLLNEAYSYILNYKQWEYVKEKMFSIEEYETKNSGYTDFQTSTVKFDKIVSNKRGEDIKATYTTQKLTTDIQYCIENPNSLDNGMILVCYEVKDGDNIVKYGNGQKSGKSIVNGDLSISTLLEKYARYEGTYKTGRINDKEYTFEFTRRVRQGKEIAFKGIFTDKLIFNNVGTGLLKSSTTDYTNELTKCTFMYRYSDIAVGGGGESIIDTGTGELIQKTAPVVTTNETASVYELSGQWNMLCGGEIVSTGDAEVTEFGVCYSASANPTTADTKCIGLMTTASRFIAGDSDIASGTYYLRAFATNAVGTSYGSQITFIIH